MTDIKQSVDALLKFQQNGLKHKISLIENQSIGLSRDQLIKLNTNNTVDINLIQSALDIKQIVGQINEIIHAVGIMLLLPYILDDDEKVEALSLGSGNTGKLFDLETSRQIAEFKFINWKGGSESIRQNHLFKDFFYLAEAETNKNRNMYVMGLEQPLKFLKGGRSLSSVLSTNRGLEAAFKTKYGLRLNKVNDYYNFHKDTVRLIDINQIMPVLARTVTEHG